MSEPRIPDSANCDPADTAAHLLALENAAMERWRQGDPFGWIEISAPEVVYIDPTLERPVVGREALRDYYAAIAGKVSYDRSRFIDPRVQQVGDAAVLSYQYVDLHVSATGKEREGTRWNCIEVYARLDGQWRIVHTQWAYTRGIEPG